jgi:methylphosphotriester-DNA--protein-cysteine methyltransferase
VERIAAANGDLGISELSERLSVSHKHLIQQFTSMIGLKPKQFARVMRFSSLLPDLLAGTAPDWTALAQAAGYHDQAHFNREFQLFAGLTPSQYLELRASYSEDYGEDGDTRFVPVG